MESRFTITEPPVGPVNAGRNSDDVSPVRNCQSALEVVEGRSPGSAISAWNRVIIHKPCDFADVGDAVAVVVLFSPNCEVAHIGHTVAVAIGLAVVGHAIPVAVCGPGEEFAGVGSAIEIAV